MGQVIQLIINIMVGNPKSGTFDLAAALKDDLEHLAKTLEGTKGGFDNGQVRA